MANIKFKPLGIKSAKINNRQYFVRAKYPGTVFIDNPTRWMSRSSYYYEPPKIKSEQLRKFNEIDRIYTSHPFYGSPRITAELNRQVYRINHKRIE